MASDVWDTVTSKELGEKVLKIGETILVVTVVAATELDTVEATITSPKKGEYIVKPIK